MKTIKVTSVVLSALLMGGAFTPSSVFAKEGEIINETNEIKQDDIQVQQTFVQLTGVVDSVEKVNGSTYYTVKEGESINVLVVSDDTLVYDNTGKKVELQKGDKVTGYADASKPVILIYPPQYNPEVIIVDKGEVGNVEVDLFNDELINVENTLKLNISEDTEVIYASGKTVKAENFESALGKQNLVVFYSVSTRSIPAQTTPTKVIVLDTMKDVVEPEISEVQKIIDTDFYTVNKTKMVPLRLIAEELGYKVESTGKGAVVSKGNVSYTITRGQKEYGYNKSLRKFKVAPALLEKGKTYVPVDFVEELMK